MIGRVVAGVVTVGLMAGIGIGVDGLLHRPVRNKPVTGPVETPVAEAAGTPEPTQESSPEPVETPAPPEKTEGATEIQYTLDEYGAGRSFTPGERMSTSIGEDIVCMWNQCVFNNDKYTGDIVVDGIAQENAMLFYVEYDDKDRKARDTYYKTVSIDGKVFWGDLNGSFTIDVPDGYKQFRFKLGAVSVPERFFGPPDTHGMYRLCVYADDELMIDTGWLDNTYLSEEPFTVNVAGCSTLRFALQQTCGRQITHRNDEEIPIYYALNPVIFDAAFTKTDSGADLPSENK